MKNQLTEKQFSEQNISLKIYAPALYQDAVKFLKEDGIIINENGKNERNIIRGRKQ